MLQPGSYLHLQNPMFRFVYIRNQRTKVQKGRTMSYDPFDGNWTEDEYDLMDWGFEDDEDRESWDDDEFDNDFDD